MERRPLDVGLIALYFAAFSAMLMVILLWQWAAGHIHASWQEKIVVLPVCFLLALLPGVLSLGLWMLDNAARIAAILFALLHAIAEIAFLSNLHVPARAFGLFRIVVDLMIMCCLCRTGIRRAFKWQPAELRLRPGGS